MGTAVHDPLLTGNLALNDVLLSADANQINNVVVPAFRFVGAGSTFSPTVESHDRRTILLDTITGSVVTLPAASGSGAIFTFVVSARPTSNAHLIQAGNATDEFRGVYIATNVVGGGDLISYPAQDADNYDTVTMNGGTEGGRIGDRTIVQDIAAGIWLLSGYATGTDPLGAGPLSSAVS